MEIAGARFLAGPNLVGDAPGLSLMLARGERSLWLEQPVPAGFAERAAQLSTGAGGYVARILADLELPPPGDAQMLRLVMVMARRALVPVSVSLGSGAMLGASEAKISVFLPCESQNAGMAALGLAVQLGQVLAGLAQPATGQLDKAIAALLSASLPPESLSEARQAAAEGVPWHRDAATGDLRFGQGCRTSSSLSSGDPGRVPSVGVTGSVGKTTTSQLISHILRGAGRTPGFGGTVGMWVGDEQVSREEFYQRKNGAPILFDPRVDTLVLEMPRGGLFSSGAAVDVLDVGVLLNVLPNHLGHHGFQTVDDIARVKSIVLRIAREAVVLNADDGIVLALREVSKARQVALFSLGPDNAAIAGHRASGGLHALRTGEGRLSFCRGSQELFGIDQQQVPAMQAMPLDTFAAAALAAGLSTFLLGIAPDAIIAGLGSFASDFAQNPGRNNRIGGLPFELILTMSDGPPGFADLARNLPPVPGGGPSFVCMTAAGDRPDDWIIAAGGAVANHFDRYLLFDWPDLRGRQPMEVPRLLVQGLARQGVPQGRVTILEAEDRVGQALSLVPDGGRLVLSYASTGGAMTSIRTFAAERGYELEL